MGMYRDSNWDVPDPGTAGDGRGDRMTLRCTVCPWSVSDTSAVRAVGAAQAHVRETGHAIIYRGVVQVWSQIDASDVQRRRGAA